MKCRKCNQKAIINMRQHKLGLCKKHFLEWIIEQTERTVKKYEMFSQEDHILVAVSGGKDSLALWDILDKLGYRADGLYIGLGIDEGIRYSYESLCMTRYFAHDRNLHLIEVDIPSKYGESIPQIAQRTQRGRKKLALSVD